MHRHRKNSYRHKNQQRYTDIHRSYYDILTVPLIHMQRHSEIAESSDRYMIILRYTQTHINIKQTNKNTRDTRFTDVHQTQHSYLKTDHKTCKSILSYIQRQRHEDIHESTHTYIKRHRDAHLYTCRYLQNILTFTETQKHKHTYKKKHIQRHTDIEKQRQTEFYRGMHMEKNRQIRTHRHTLTKRHIHRYTPLNTHINTAVYTQKHTERHICTDTETYTRQTFEQPRTHKHTQMHQIYVKHKIMNRHTNVTHRYIVG